MSVEVPSSKICVTPDQASNLALVINELVTNSIKYALADRITAQIHVDIALQNGDISFRFSDDGPGYPENVLCLECHNVGFDLVKNIVRKSLHGTVSLFNDNGAVTVVQFRAQAH